MPVLLRATTTTNAQGRRNRLGLPSAYKSLELDADYLQALKVFRSLFPFAHFRMPLQVIDRTRREPNVSSLSGKKPLRERQSRSFYQLSSTLTPIGQEAMIKTYEDTLINHLTNVYSSKRIGAVLPRLPTATFRERLPSIKNNEVHRDNIKQAQHLIDNILNNQLQKDDMLCDYVRWQQNWSKYS